MKNTLVTTVILLLISSLLVSCDKLSIAHLNQDISLYMQIGVVKAGSYTYSETVYNNDLPSKLAEHNTSIDKLESFQIDGFEVWLTMPVDGNFDPFDELYAYIDAGNLGEQEIAALNPVPDGGQNHISFHSNESQELKDYFKEDEITFRLKGSNSDATIEVTEIKITIHGRMEASVL